MTSQTPGRGVSGPETPMEEHPAPALDLDAILDTWLAQCPACDAGLPSSCTHPTEDYRPVMLDLVREVQRLHTWRGLMSLVDEHYPLSVFPVLSDDPDRDLGPRILSLLRRLDEAAPKPGGWAQTLFDQRDAALEALARVRLLHTCSRPDPRYADHCTHCLTPWPCETTQALRPGDGPCLDP